MNYYFYNQDGMITKTGSTNDPTQKTTPPGEFMAIGDADQSRQYVDGGALVDFPPQPSEFHQFDYTTKTWVENLSQAKQAKLNGVSIGYSFVCNGEDPATNKDIFVDCVVSGTTYRMNAGQEAATNMDAGVRIFELSGASYMPVVRDFYNVNHANVPIADARSIALQQGADALNHWQQKGAFVDAINACTTVEEVQAIDITFNVNVL